MILKFWGWYFASFLVLMNCTAYTKDVTLCLFNGDVNTVIDPILAGFALAVKEKQAPIIASTSLVNKMVEVVGNYNEQVAAW